MFMSETLHKHSEEEDEGRIADVGEAHDEAKIEYAGRNASDRVKKGLFMSATKFSKLQDEAYNEAATRAAAFQKSDREWHAAIDPPPFDDDDWSHDSGWR